jgi:glutathione S-transferase
LQTLETHLTREDRTGPYLVGNGEILTLADCSLAPKLYHMQTGLKAFKDNAVDVASSFPATQSYMDAVFARQSFVEGLYPEETVVWGWSNARQPK